MHNKKGAIGKKISFILLFLITGLINGSSQHRSSFVKKLVAIDTCVIEMDTLIIDPSSIFTNFSDQFTIQGGKLILDCDRKDYYGRYEFSYRTLNIDFKSPSFLLNADESKAQESAIDIGYAYNPFKNDSENGLIDRSTLNYNGSISRGFSVGNSQSLVLNSNLNLQLNGNLGNGIEVVAAISDDNIPIQADGNTQLLQEFDRVFIKVSKDQTSVIAGDYDLQSTGQSYFMRYLKKLQGLRLDNEMIIGRNYLKSNVNFAISRGKFARQQIEVREGNQGPYKLRGNNGERFLIVLQGSEKVYYDGVLMTRGQDYDYIIDYNNAEITFTPQRLIRRESRIIVEYEYTDQNYLRSLYAANVEYGNQAYSLRLNIYNEQDSKNATGQIELDSTDINILTSATDDPFSLLRSGIRRLPAATVNENTIFYLPRIDPATGDTILVYVRDMQEGVVTAVFSEVNPGVGSYIIDVEAGANGRVYQYVGIGNGNYLPVIQLIPPEKRQMMSIGASTKLTDRISLEGETSLSNFDNNRFSNLDNANNQGMASNIKLVLLPPDTLSDNWSMQGKFEYEYLNKNFRSLNPFRNQEFSRDWNIVNLPSTREQLFKTDIILKRGQDFTVDYQLTTYDREFQYRGYRHIPRLKWRSKNSSLKVFGNILTSESESEETRFFRPEIDFTQKFPALNNWQLRLRYFAEGNRRKFTDSELLQNSSFSFDEYYGYISSPIDDRKNITAFVKRRVDKLPSLDQLITAAIVDEGGVEGMLRTNSTGLNWNLTYRDFRVNEPSLINEQNTSTLLGRVDFNFKAWDGFVQSTSSINVGSGQEAKREFQFIKVEKGEGNYIYLGDLNNDGEEQINEYEIAVFADQADYIRVNIVNNEFIRTENQTINQSLRIQPDKIFKNKQSTFAKAIAKISINSILRVSQKRNSESGESSGFLHFNPQDTATVSYNSTINNILFFNRGNPIYDFQFGNRRTNNRFVQITGFEQRNNNTYFFKTRVNPKRYIDLIFATEWGSQVYDSEFFDNKDLDIKQVLISPRVVYRPSLKLRFTTFYEYTTRKQNINEKERSESHEFTQEITWRQASKSSLNASLSIVNIDFQGATNTPVSYALLAGLNGGSNYLWNIDFTRRLSGNVDLTISYEGRNTGNVPTVHIARAQVRANF